ncbi:MAG TPA: hypothetical protein DCX17_00160 [Firmicutes bacterium]|nr:hypothetical protein [Bacillota bacterium]
MRKHYLGLLIAPLAVVLLAGCGSSVADAPVGLVKSNTYRTTYGTDPTTFNSVKTNEQPNSQHIANFIDGLVENDVHGRIVPALAESWTDTMEGTKQVWTFELRETNWVDADGEILFPVKADDWVYAAEQALDSLNASGVVYLYWMFIDGSYEYYDLLDRYNNYASGADVNLIDPEHEDYDPDYVRVTEAPDFDMVGIKAIDDDTLEFTLPNAMSYFPTVLTYSVFFPISRQFVQNIGGWDNYGVINTPSTAQESIAYNGAFLLQSYTESNSIVYVKNPHYWDKDSVSVEFVNQTYVPEDAGFNWARLKFEAGVIDGFNVTQQDVAGWEKYVEGPAGTGTMEAPAHEAAYTTSGSLYGASYYMSFNYKRPRPLVDTALNETQVSNLEKALKNVHFRRAFMYAVDKGALNARRTPNSPNDWTTNTYTINGLAVDSNGKDYVEYIYEKFAAENDITVEAAKELIAPGKPGIRNVDMAKAEMRLAKPELEAAGVTFPIEAEYWFLANANLTPYYEAVVDSIDDAIGTVDSVKILNNTIYTTAKSTNAFYYYQFSIQIGNFGWGPDYGDPSTYLNTFKIGGDLTPNLGLTDPVLAEEILGEYDDLLATADAITDLEDRFAAYAEAEYKLVFEDAILIPFMKPYSAGITVSVSKVQPRTIPATLYGNSGEKLKFVVVYNRTLTKAEIEYFREQFLAETE